MHPITAFGIIITCLVVGVVMIVQSQSGLDCYPRGEPSPYVSGTAKLSVDGKYMITFEDGIPHLRNAETSRIEAVLNWDKWDDMGNTDSFLYMPERRQLIYSDSIKIAAVDIDSGKVNGLYASSSMFGKIRNVAYSVDHNYAVVLDICDIAVADTRLRRQDIHKIVADDCPKILSVTGSVSISPDNKYIAVASPDNTAKLYDFDSHNLVLTIQIEDAKGSILNITFSPDGKSLLIADDNNSIVLWDIANNVPTWSLKSLDNYGSNVDGFGFSPDGKYVAVASDGWNGRPSSYDMWQVGQQLPLREFKPQLGNLYSPDLVVFSEDGKTLYVANSNGFLAWDVATGHQLIDCYVALNRGQFIPGILLVIGGMLLTSVVMGRAVEIIFSKRIQA